MKAADKKEKRSYKAGTSSQQAHQLTAVISNNQMATHDKIQSKWSTHEKIQSTEKVPYGNSISSKNRPRDGEYSSGGGKREEWMAKDSQRTNKNEKNEKQQGQKNEDIMGDWVSSKKAGQVKNTVTSLNSSKNIISVFGTVKEKEAVNTLSGVKGEGSLSNIPPKSALEGENGLKQMQSKDMYKANNSQNNSIKWNSSSETPNHKSKQMIIGSHPQLDAELSYQSNKDIQKFASQCGFNKMNNSSSDKIQVYRSEPNDSVDDIDHSKLKARDTDTGSKKLHQLQNFLNRISGGSGTNIITSHNRNNNNNNNTDNPNIYYDDKRSFLSDYKNSKNWSKKGINNSCIQEVKSQRNTTANNILNDSDKDPYFNNLKKKGNNKPKKCNEGYSNIYKNDSQIDKLKEKTTSKNEKWMTDINGKIQLQDTYNSIFTRKKTAPMFVNTSTHSMIPSSNLSPKSINDSSISNSEISIKNQQIMPFSKNKRIKEDTDGLKLESNTKEYFKLKVNEKDYTANSKNPYYNADKGGEKSDNYSSGYTKQQLNSWNKHPKNTVLAQQGSLNSSKAKAGQEYSNRNDVSDQLTNDNANLKYFSIRRSNQKKNPNDKKNNNEQIKYSSRLVNAVEPEQKEIETSYGRAVKQELTRILSGDNFKKWNSPSNKVNSFMHQSKSYIKAKESKNTSKNAIKERNSAIADNYNENSSRRGEDSASDPESQRFRGCLNGAKPESNEQLTSELDYHVPKSIKIKKRNKNSKKQGKSSRLANDFHSSLLSPDSDANKIVCLEKKSGSIHGGNSSGEPAKRKEFDPKEAGMFKGWNSMGEIPSYKESNQTPVCKQEWKNGKQLINNSAEGLIPVSLLRGGNNNDNQEFLKEKQDCLQLIVSTCKNMGMKGSNLLSSVNYRSQKNNLGLTGNDKKKEAAQTKNFNVKQTDGNLRLVGGWNFEKRSGSSPVEICLEKSPKTYENKKYDELLLSMFDLKLNNLSKNKQILQSRGARNMSLNKQQQSESIGEQIDPDLCISGKNLVGKPANRLDFLKSSDKANMNYGEKSNKKTRIRINKFYDIDMRVIEGWRNEKSDWKDKGEGIRRDDKKDVVEYCAADGDDDNCQDLTERKISSINNTNLMILNKRALESCLLIGFNLKLLFDSVRIKKNWYDLFQEYSELCFYDWFYNIPNIFRYSEVASIFSTVLKLERYSNYLLFCMRIFDGSKESDLVSRYSNRAVQSEKFDGSSNSRRSKILGVSSSRSKDHIFQIAKKVCDLVEKNFNCQWQWLYRIWKEAGSASLTHFFWVPENNIVSLGERYDRTWEASVGNRTSGDNTNRDSKDKCSQKSSFDFTHDQLFIDIESSNLELVVLLDKLLDFDRKFSAKSRGRMRSILSEIEEIPMQKLREELVAIRKMEYSESDEPLNRSRSNNNSITHSKPGTQPNSRPGSIWNKNPAQPKQINQIIPEKGNQTTNQKTEVHTIKNPPISNCNSKNLPTTSITDKNTKASLKSIKSSKKIKKLPESSETLYDQNIFKNKKNSTDTGSWKCKADDKFDDCNYQRIDEKKVKGSKNKGSKPKKSSSKKKAQENISSNNSGRNKSNEQFHIKSLANTINMKNSIEASTFQVVPINEVPKKPMSQYNMIEGLKDSIATKEIQREDSNNDLNDNQSNNSVLTENDEAGMEYVGENKVSDKHRTHNINYNIDDFNNVDWALTNRTPVSESHINQDVCNEIDSMDFYMETHEKIPSGYSAINKSEKTEVIPVNEKIQRKETHDSEKEIDCDNVQIENLQKELNESFGDKLVVQLIEGNLLSKKLAPNHKNAVKSGLDRGKLLRSSINPGFFFQPDMLKASQFANLIPEIRPDRSYTLVLDLDETLIHLAEEKDGDYIYYRPNVQEFLEDMSQYYELVIFTASIKAYADMVLDELDPKGLIAHRLYRNHTTFTGYSHLKNLSKLGRDLSKVLIVDNKPENFELQPLNGVYIKSWYDDPEDDLLMQLSSYLKNIVINKEKDVRVALQKYKIQAEQQIEKEFKKSTKVYNLYNLAEVDED